MALHKNWCCKLVKIILLVAGAWEQSVVGSMIARLIKISGAQVTALLFPMHLVQVDFRKNNGSGA